jgi:HAD superfamily hydrolase (TIGR01548 family)
MAKDLVIFDMDGVLVEVTESYRATIQAVVKHFTGYEPTRGEIQDWKNRGGWNDDWLLSHAMIKAQGIDATYEEVVQYFQKLFLGENNDGMIAREKWIAEDGLFDRLAASYTLAVYTGRLRSEAQITLNRFAPGLFKIVIGSDDVVNPKPHPEGLLTIFTLTDHGKCWYIGDTVDDAAAAQAAAVRFIGIADPDNPRYDELVELLNNEGAIAILDDINGLEPVLAQNV